MTDEISFVVTNTTTFVSGKLNSELYKQFKKALGYIPEDAMFAIEAAQSDPNKPWAKDWDGTITTVCYNKGTCRCPIKKQGMHFPTGVISRACDFFNKYHIPYKIYDKREAVNKSLSLSMSESFEPRDYQQESVNKALNSQRGLIKVATGGGKTAISSNIIQQLNVSPFIFYVTSRGLLEQARVELSRFIIDNGSPLDVGVIGDGKCDIKDVNVMTVQTAVRASGGKYKRFDEEESGKREKPQTKERYAEIRDLIMSSKGMICDECVTGDTLVYTDKGKIKIEDIENLNCSKILSHNGDDFVWCNIDHFIQRNNRKIIEIKLYSGGVIKCTKNHPILTREGWKKAGQLTENEEVLKLAHVVAEKKFMAEDKNMYLDTRSKNEQQINGELSTTSYLKKPHYATVAVVNKFYQKPLPWSDSLNLGELEHIENSFMDMINDPKNGACSLQNWKSRPFLGLCSGILQSVTPLKEAKTQDCHATMGVYRKNGLRIRQNFLNDYRHTLKMSKMVDMGIKQHIFTQDVCHAYERSMTKPIETAKKPLVQNGLNLLEISDSHGGLGMTEVFPVNYAFIQKASLEKSKNLLLNGYVESLENQKQEYQKENTYTSPLCQKQEKRYSQECENIYQNACSIKWERISKIKDAGRSNVYDIEVEDTHCFFANNILVHNCQHWRADICQIISDMSVSCRYRYGASATPFRDAGDDILIDACFGRMICDINASFLINRGWLVRPDIYFMPINNMRGVKSGTYQTMYKDAIVENAVRNQLIANAAINFADQGGTILILCKHIAHGKILEELIPSSIFLHGAHSSKKREAHMAKMRGKEASITISSTIFDEGIDVKPLDTLILAGSGKSATRALQRVGRVLRPFEGKDSATVIDFMDNCKYMLGHSKRRKHIYETEPEFNIKMLEG